MNTPFFDPSKTYEENFHEGPFGVFKDGKKLSQIGKPNYNFLGEKVFMPFGIPAGPLLNGTFVKAALDKGFDLPVYKTVRTHKHKSNKWPNVLSVHTKDNLTLENAEQGIVADNNYSQPIAITNSFGVPSFDPDFWQKDMKEASDYAKEGQVVIGSFQGTTNARGDVKAYIKDFTDAARLTKETGTKILEANLSCPNEGTSNLLCFDVVRSKEVLTSIKNTIGNTPLIIKIGYFKSQEELIKFVKEVGNIIDAVSAINTIPAKIFDKEGKQALPGENRLYSGVCGHPIKWAGLNMTKRLKKLREDLRLSFAIIGVGGVTTPDDYTEYKNAGANAVMSATGAMWNPFLAQEIKNKINE